MAGSSSSSFNKTHLQDSNPTSFSSSIRTKPPKSKFPFTHYFFSKSLIIILVLLVFSFFPSQVPEFFKKTTIITKIWELIYLLVIGIAVCYGLFSRKMVSVHSSDESAHSDDNIVVKETFLSGISHISSIFEDGIQNSYGFDEKGVFEECKGSGSSFSEFGNGFGKSDGKKLNQYFLGESMVVINDENYVLEQLGKPKTSKENKPLCLPVRSLGSKSLESDAVKSSNGDGCSSVVKDSSGGWDGMKNGKFRGLVPIKLEEKFEETDSDSPTPLNWSSKSMRLEKREDMYTAEANETSHFRPLSVGVFDFEGLRSQSMRFLMSSQMKNSSEKEESKGMETNHGYRQPYLNGETSFMESKPQEFSIGTSDEMNMLMGSREIRKDFRKTKVTDGGDRSFINAKHQRSSIGASSEMNTHVSSKHIMKDFGKIKAEGGAFDSNDNTSFIKSKHQWSSIGASSEMNLEAFEYVLGKEDKADSSNYSLKPAFDANTYKRGKSVRTNRPKERILEAKVKIFPSQTDDKVEKGSKLGTSAMNVNLDEARSTIDNSSDTEPHSGEVDRKADEFIAKFREQIRLQQAASARRLNLW